jgi:hypothetical protein
MSDSLHWTWEANIKEGEEEGFKALAKEWAAFAAEEPGTLHSEWTISEDGKAVRVDQWFVDAAAAYAQFLNNTCWRRLDDHLQPTRMTVCGKSNEQLAFLRDHGAIFMVPIED